MAEQNLNTPRPFLAGTRIRNLLGQRFGRLLVIQYAGKTATGNTLWLCACSCGEPTTVQSSALTAGNCSSCGCLNREKFKERITKHGGTSRKGKTPEYQAFSDAKQRCENPKHKWHPRYGGRGIEFRFASFEEFLAEMGPRPSDLHSLDRADNDGHYEPGNVQWTTKRGQSLNTCRTVQLTINGVSRLLHEWSSISGTKLQTIWTRKRKRGWCDACSVYNKTNDRCSHAGPTMRGRHSKLPSQPIE